MTISVNGFNMQSNTGNVPSGAPAGLSSQTDNGRTGVASLDVMPRLLLNHRFTYKLGGTITEEGVNKRRVARVYRRRDGAFAGEYLSRADGRFNFGHLDPLEKYQVVTLDADAAPVYNDLIAGQLVPVLTVVENTNYPPGGVP